MKKKCLALILALILGVSPLVAFGDTFLEVVYSPSEVVCDFSDVAEVEYVPVLEQGYEDIAGVEYISMQEHSYSDTTEVEYTPEVPDDDNTLPSDGNGNGYQMFMQPDSEEIGDEDDTTPQSNGDGNGYHTPTQPDNDDNDTEVGNEDDTTSPNNENGNDSGDTSNCGFSGYGYVGINPTIGQMHRFSWGPLNIYCHYTTTPIGIELFNITWNSAFPQVDPLYFEYAFADIEAVIPQGWELERSLLTFGVSGRPDLSFTQANPAPVEEIANGIFRYTFPSAPNAVSPNAGFLPAPAIRVYVRPKAPTISKESELISPATIPLLPGDIIEYTLTVTNPAIVPNYDDPWWFDALINFNNFTIADTLPAGLVMHSFTPVVTGARGAPVVTTTTNSISATLDLPGANQPPGNGVVTITFQAVVTNDIPWGANVYLENMASLDGPNTELPIDDEDSIRVAAPPTLTKSITHVNGAAHTNQVVRNGDTITYRLTVNNPHNRTLNDFLVRDTLPPGLTGITGITVSPGSYTVGPNNATGVLELILNLPPGDTHIDFNVTVNDVTLSNAGGNFVNIARLFGPPRTADHPTTPSERPEVDDATANIPVATTLTGTVTCELTGRPIPNVTIRLYRYYDGEYVFDRDEQTNQHGFFDFGNIPTGRLRARMYYDSIPDNYVVTHGGNRDWVAQHGGAYEEHFRVRPPLPEIEKTVNPITARPGTMVTYTITIDTNGMSALKFADIIMEDSLLPAQTFLDLTTVVITSITGISNPSAVTFNTTTNVLRAANMQLNTEGTGYASEVVIIFTAYVIATADLGDVIVNTAYLSITTYERNPAFDPTEPVSDTNPIRIPTGGTEDIGNDTATVTVSIDPALSKTASYVPDRLMRGDTVTYTLTIATNELTRAEFLDVVVRDPLHVMLVAPFNLVSVVGATGHSHTFTGNVFEIRDMQLNTDGTGYVDEVVITFTATVAANAPVGSIPNIASLFRYELGNHPNIDQANPNCPFRDIPYPRHINSDNDTVSIPPPTLTGTVTCYLTSDPVPGVRVYLRDGNGDPVLDGSGNPRYEVTNALGEFDFGEVPVGDLIVYIDRNTIPSGYFVVGGHERELTTLPGGAYHEDFYVAPYPTLIGTLTCEDTGRRIPGATVRLYQRDEETGEWVFTGQQVTTNPNGEFDFGEVPAGELEIRVSNIPAGYAQRNGSRRGVTTVPGQQAVEHLQVGVPSPTIVKAVVSPAPPATVNRGGTVTYTITIDTDGMLGIDFLNVVVRDPLPASLVAPFNVVSVTGVTSWDGGFTGNELRITDMQLATSAVNAHGYVNEVVITFTATVAANAPAGSIPNTAWLYYYGANPDFNPNIPEGPTNPRRVPQSRTSNANVTVNVPSVTPPGGGGGGGTGDGGGSGGGSGGGGSAGGGGWSGSSVTPTPGASTPGATTPGNHTPQDLPYATAQYDTYPETYHYPNHPDTDHQYVPSLYTSDTGRDNYAISSDMDTDTGTSTGTNVSTTRRNPQTGDDTSFRGLFVSAIGFILMLTAVFFLIGRRRDIYKR